MTTIHDRLPDLRRDAGGVVCSDFAATMEAEPAPVLDLCLSGGVPIPTEVRGGQAQDAN
jgi:hypothetical protein